MREDQIRTSIVTVYKMLWNVLALYERTDSYNEIPEGEMDIDIGEYMEIRLLEVRTAIEVLFSEEYEIKASLDRIVDEAERFVRMYERPGVVKRWRRINPQMVFFDPAFELMTDCPEMYLAVSWGFTDFKLDCYPDQTLSAARKKYFAKMKKIIEKSGLSYTEDRAFQIELLRTLNLVFKKDFHDYL